MSAVAAADVVFVALKAYSLPGIAPRLGKLLAPGAAAVWAQNGIPWWYLPVAAASAGGDGLPIRPPPRRPGKRRPGRGDRWLDRR